MPLGRAGAELEGRVLDMAVNEHLSAVDLAADIKAKGISPVEVMDDCIAAIEARNPSINAFTYTAFDEARAKAIEAEKVLMRGDADGAFFGIPTAAKDFLPGVPGWPGTTGGVKALSHQKDPGYGCFTKAMVDEGAILVGKTNAPSFAFRGTCDNKMFGATSTPFKVGYNSGGSSGGSAAAVADGLLPIAEGTDGGGSIRIPAAWCGIVGYKPSLGLVSNSPRPDGFGTSHPFCFDGAQTRTIEDAARALTEMAYYDPREPFSIDWGKIDFTEALGAPIEGKRIAFTPDFGLYEVDPEVAAIVERAAKRFEEAGAIVNRLDFSLKSRTHIELAEAWCQMVSIVNSESILAWKDQGIDLIKDYPEDISPELIYWTLDSYRRSYRDLIRNDTIRTEVFDAMQNAFEKFDFIVSPTNACNPPANDPNRNTLVREVNGKPVEPLIGWCLTYFCNFTGHPAISVPAGFAKDGSPVGMQIIGQRYNDKGVLSMGSAFEEIQPWAHIYDERVENRKL